MNWGTGVVPGSDEVYLLVRKNADGRLQAVRFDRGIIRRMDVDEYEWKDLDDVPGAFG